MMAGNAGKVLLVPVQHDTELCPVGLLTVDRRTFPLVGCKHALVRPLIALIRGLPSEATGGSAPARWGGRGPRAAASICCA
jgi:hypothetical protein